VAPDCGAREREAGWRGVRERGGNNGRTERDYLWDANNEYCVLNFRCQACTYRRAREEVRGEAVTLVHGVFVASLVCTRAAAAAAAADRRHGSGRRFLFKTQWK